MTVHQKMAGIVVAGSICVISLNPTSIAAHLFAVAALALYAFTVFIERKENEGAARLEARINELEGKVQNISIAKGFGR